MCSSYCDNCSQGAGNCKTVKNMIKKLATYEDLEEQGLLVRLPCKVALDNIHNSKTAKILTSDATICIQPDKISLIELKEINGVPSLVVPVNGELKINGIEVELR